jgi:ETC complex I subunit conserved region
MTTGAGARRDCRAACCRREAAIPVAYIYQPARSPMQSGLARLHEWVLEFAPWSAAEIEPLMGWTSSRDPFASIPRLRFPDRESAIAFAERHGWHYLARDPPIRRFRPKSTSITSSTTWPASSTVGELNGKVRSASIASEFQRGASAAAPAEHDLGASRRSARENLRKVDERQGAYGRVAQAYRLPRRSGRTSTVLLNHEEAP